VSFILDALKKSENERQRQAGPGFATVPESTAARPRKIWPIVVVALLAINLVVIGAVFMRNSAEAPPADTVARPNTAAATAGADAAARPGQTAVTQPRATPPTSTTAAAPPQAETVEPQPLAAAPKPVETAPAMERDREVRSLADEAATDTLVTGPAGGAAAAPGNTEPPPARPRAAAPGTETGSSSAEGLPTANDLRIEGFLTGPPLHLDLHVYYPESRRRVVFISGSKYREGDTVKGGPVIREIVPEGVILEERGRRYLLMPD